MQIIGHLKRISVSIAVCGLLAACGGGIEPASTDSQDENSLGNVRALATTSSVTTWTKVASEGGTFSLPSLQPVRYGKEPTWIERTLVGAVSCTNAFFGTDPLPGVSKECQAGSEAPSVSDWSRVAVEGQGFTVAENTRVRYGGASSWVEKVISGTAPCSNAYFGVDPLPGVAKECQKSNASSATTGSWQKLVDEGASFTVGNGERVRYGAGLTWIERTLSGNGTCSNVFFGTDPVPGVRKQCDRYSDSSPPTTTMAWVFCAREGGQCAFAGTKKVRYGGNGSYVEATRADGTACTTVSFGRDPAPGVVKACEIETPVSTDPNAYGPPQYISKGGVYSGSWESTDPNLPTVTISTTEPVVISDCRLKGPGTLVYAYAGADVTVKNCAALGTVPMTAGLPQGRFVHTWRVKRLVIENNTVRNTAGVIVQNDRQPSQEVRIRYNKVENVEGRLADGLGGYSSAQVALRHFTQLSYVRDSANVEVAWNQIINTPFASRSEENINVFRSTGTATGPIQIHDNYIQGAYAADPIAQGYSGGGIITDGLATTLADATGYVNIFNNQVVGTSNQGITIAHGHDVKVYGNRMIGSGLLTDGRRIKAANVGAVMTADSNDVAAGMYFNNSITGNTVGWVNGSGVLNNFWFPACTGTNRCDGNTALSGPITLQSETDEFTRWNSKLGSAGIAIGSTKTN